MRIEWKDVPGLLAYNAALACCWPALWGWYSCRGGTDGKYSENRRARLGLELPQKRRTPGPLAWFHALSVGETMSCIPMVRAFKEICPEVQIVFSTATETGQTMARQNLGGVVSTFFYAPHDFPWSVKSLTRRLNPDLFVLIETDIWPNLLHVLSQRRVPAVLVNGRLSDKSFKRLLKVRDLFRPILEGFQRVFVQSGADAVKYWALGVPALAIETVGNLKFDAVPRLEPGEISLLRAGCGIEDTRPVWIAGSTHPGEEEALLRIHSSLMTEIPELLLILAPRQVKRAGELVRLCEQHGLRTRLRSAGGFASGCPVFVLDTLGELASFYSVAKAAFVGGSLIPFGGHNPLEATAQGVPVFWGPHLSNFREIEAGLLTFGCGGRVQSAAELQAALRSVLLDPVRASAMNAACGRFIRENSMASERIACALRKMMPQGRGLWAGH